MLQLAAVDVPYVHSSISTSCWDKLFISAPAALEQVLLEIVSRPEEDFLFTWFCRSVGLYVPHSHCIVHAIWEKVIAGWAQWDRSHSVGVTNQVVLNLMFAKVYATDSVVNAAKEDDWVSLVEGDARDLVADLEAGRVLSLSDIP